MSRRFLNVTGGLKKFLKRFEGPGAKYLRFTDPSKGIEYNKLSINYHIAKCLYSVDIARTPNVTKGFVNKKYLNPNVNAAAAKVNGLNLVINCNAHKAKGNIR